MTRLAETTPVVPTPIVPTLGLQAGWLISKGLALIKARRQLFKNTSRRAQYHLLRLGLNLGRRLMLPSGKGALPPVLLVAVTGQCNLHCRQCFIHPDQRQQAIPAEKLEQLLQKAEAADVALVGFTGGEPLMRPDTLDMIERHPRLYFQLFSNGHLIDEPVACRLGRAGNVTVFLGMDGPSTGADQRRGDGAADQAMQAMRRLVTAGVPSGASVMVTRRNLAQVTDIRWMRELQDAGCLLAVFVPYTPAGRGYDPALILTPQGTLDLGRRERQIQRECRLIVASDHWSGKPCLFSAGQALYVNQFGELGICPAAPFSNVIWEGGSLHTALQQASFLRRVYAHHRQGHPCLLRHDPAALAALIAQEDACSERNREALALLHHRAAVEFTAVGATAETTLNRNCSPLQRFEAESPAKGQTHASGHHAATLFQPNPGAPRP